MINTAFDGVVRVKDGIDLLRVFYGLAIREAVTSHVEKKTVDLYPS